MHGQKYYESRTESALEYYTNPSYGQLTNTRWFKKNWTLKWPWWRVVSPGGCKAVIFKGHTLGRNKGSFKTWWVVDGHVVSCSWVTVACPGILFGGVSTNSVEDRENGDLGAVASLVSGSEGSCNLVQEISFHIVKFSKFLVLYDYYDDNQFICHC